jgi:uncharacterized membrane protein YsdA (DUF1294 family)/cold shock CspA family protein
LLHKGKIETWNDDKGFGFIRPNNKGDRVFIHIKAFSVRNIRPEKGDVVVYSVAKDAQGRFRAVNAKFASDKKPQRSSRRASLPVNVFALLFLGVVGYSVRETGLPRIVLIAYAALSVIAFAAYAIDKSAAQAGRWRTKESTLHILALAGGWPGALMAQQILRHKSSKDSFRYVFAITVVVNLTGLFWLHTTDGRAFLQQLF